MQKQLFKTILLTVIAILLQTVPANAATVVSTIAGTSRSGHLDGFPSKVNFPEGMVKNAAGQIYFADRKNNRIRVLNTDNTVTTLTGSTAGHADGSLAIALFNHPVDLTLDNDENLIVVEYNNHTVRKIDLSTNTVSTLAGVPASAGYQDHADPLLAKFDRPHGVAVDATGNIYVAEWGNTKIRKIDSVTQAVTTFAGSNKGFANNVNPLLARFNRPVDLAFNNAKTILYVAEDNNERVRQINLATGEVSTFAGSSKGYLDHTDPLQAQFKALHSLFVDANDSIYVTDRGGHKIRKIDGTTKAVTTIVGFAELAETFDGDISTAAFRSPSGIVKDNSGNLVIASRSHSIRKIHPKDQTTIFVPPSGGNPEPENNKPLLVLVHDLDSQSTSADAFQIVSAQRIRLKAIALDIEDGESINNKVQWTSNIDGFITESLNLETESLSIGTHIITLSATDSEGLKGSYEFTLDIVETVDELSFSDSLKTQIEADIQRITTLDTIDGDFSVEILDVASSKKRFKKFKKKGLIKANAWSFDTDSETSTFSAVNVNPQITWSSDIDGNLGSGEKVLIKKTLSLGDHSISANIGDKSSIIRVRVKKKNGKKVLRLLD